MTQILFKKNHPDAVMPTRATEHAAAFDLVAATVEYDLVTNVMVVDTGLSTAFPEGYVLHLYGRSGLAMKHGIRLCNSVAVIDADYRGPLKILLRSDHSWVDINWHIKPGERVAQAILMKLPDTEWVEATELPESIRGEGGFGSTGTGTEPQTNGRPVRDA